MWYSLREGISGWIDDSQDALAGGGFDLLSEVYEAVVQQQAADCC